jgi:hypothetical protein
VDEGSDEQLNKAPAMNGHESTGKRMDVPPLALGFNAPLDPKLHQILSPTHVKNVKGGASGLLRLPKAQGNR